MNLFEILKLTHSIKLIFITGRSWEHQETFTISYNGKYECECSHENKHFSFQCTNEFINKCLPNYVFVGSVLIEDQSKTKTCVFYNIGRTM